MAILDEQRRERGLAMLFITHDLDLAAAVCDRTIVMYAGRIVEDQRVRAACTSGPLHPYTAALVARAARHRTRTAERLRADPGPPALRLRGAGRAAPFAPRCPYVRDELPRGARRRAAIGGSRGVPASRLRGAAGAAARAEAPAHG